MHRSMFYRPWNLVSAIDHLINKHVIDNVHRTSFDKPELIQILILQMYIVIDDDCLDVKAQYTIKYALIANYAHTDTHRHKVNIVQQL
jgi:hypothetical protein